MDDLIYFRENLDFESSRGSSYVDNFMEELTYQRSGYNGCDRCVRKEITLW